MPRQNLELDPISPRQPGKCTCHDYRLVQIFQHKTQCRGCVGHGILTGRTRQGGNRSGGGWEAGTGILVGTAPLNLFLKLYSPMHINCADEWARSEMETAIKPYKKTHEPLNMLGTSSKTLASIKPNVMARKGSNFTNKKNTKWHIQGNQGSNIYHLYQSTFGLIPRIETCSKKNKPCSTPTRKRHGNQGPRLKNLGNKNNSTPS